MRDLKENYFFASLLPSSHLPTLTCCLGPVPTYSSNCCAALSTRLALSIHSIGYQLLDLWSLRHLVDLMLLIDLMCLVDLPPCHSAMRLLHRLPVPNSISLYWLNQHAIDSAANLRSPRFRYLTSCFIFNIFRSSIPLLPSVDLICSLSSLHFPPPEPLVLLIQSASMRFSPTTYLRSLLIHLLNISSTSILINFRSSWSSDLVRSGFIFTSNMVLMLKVRFVLNLQLQPNCRHQLSIELLIARLDPALQPTCWCFLRYSRPISVLSPPIDWSQCCCRCLLLISVLGCCCHPISPINQIVI